MKTALSVIALLLAVLAAMLLIPLWFHGDAKAPTSGLPWQVEALPNGQSRVFGLTLGSSTLADARQHWGNDVQVALIAAPGEPGAVEGFYDNVVAGFISGKMILTVDLPDDLLRQMRERAVKSEYMESATRRITLSPEDKHRAEQAPIRAISFIPGINLDESMVQQRFGPPAERIPAGENLEHLLYPAQGLDVVLDRKGKEILQYVAPSRFAQVRAPLVANSTGKKE